MDDFQSPSLATGPVVQSGDPQYQQAAVKGYQASTQAPYQEALRRMQQGDAANGTLGSGMDQLGQLGMAQQHQADIGGFAQKAALAGADVGEENRRREEQRQWQVQDLNRQWSQLQQEIASQQGFQTQQQGTQMLAGLAGGVGSMIGGPLAGGFASWAAKQGMEAGQPKANNPGLPSDYTDYNAPPEP
jgi:hypothetical protein